MLKSIHKCVIIVQQLFTVIIKKGVLKMKTLKPEACYVIDYSITSNFVQDAYKNNSTVTGIVTDIDEENRRVIVCLGESLNAEMPWEEATIYNLETRRTPGKIPHPIAGIKYKKIRAKVKAIKSDGTIVLSRRDNMLEAWETVVNSYKQHTYTASVIGYYHSGVFYDIGEGICAFCYVKEHSMCRVDIIKWVKLNDMAEVKIMGEPCMEEDYKIYCSRKLASDLTYYDYKVGQVVLVRVSNPVYRGKEITGFFVEIAPNVSGIADYLRDTIPVHNGD